MNPPEKITDSEKKTETSQADIAPLLDLIRALRAKDGCPWDRKQTPRSMAVYLVEEIYELADAIASDDPEAVREELGDVLFHILFIARIFQEKGQFDLDEVVTGICRKMHRRHPHVFGQSQVSSTEDIKRQWHEIKKEEKKDSGQTSILDTIPTSMPALMRAYLISERAARAGFDWDDIAGVMLKAEEEWSEFKAEIEKVDGRKKPGSEASMEFGDILFTLVNVARFAKIHPETALFDATRKFENRFKYMESCARKEGKSLESVPRDRMERMWDAAKKIKGNS